MTPDDIDALAILLYEAGAQRLGLVQSSSWEGLSDYWRQGYRHLARVALQHMDGRIRHLQGMVESLAARVAAQAELLSTRAEK